MNAQPGKLHRSVSGRSRSHRGLSLMEVMLALAILGVSIAAVGELVRVGVRSAAAARDLTMAQLICQSKMSEIVAGGDFAESTSSVVVEGFPDWLYSVDVAPIAQEGLIDIQVTVSRDLEAGQRPVFFKLNRWMIDPEYELQLLEAAEEEALAASGGDNG